VLLNHGTRHRPVGAGTIELDVFFPATMTCSDTVFPTRVRAEEDIVVVFFILSGHSTSAAF
jgi:hypothetical protein